MDLTKAKDLALDKMNTYGLLADGWTFGFDRAVSRFGLTKFAPVRRISLSEPLTRMNSEEETLDTILHEIAHALAGGKAGHGPIWRSKFLAMGGSGRRTADAAKVVAPPKKLVGTCPNGHTTFKDRRPSKAMACGTCCRTYNRGRYSDQYLFTYRPNVDMLTRNV